MHGRTVALFQQADTRLLAWTACGVWAPFPFDNSVFCASCSLRRLLRPLAVCSCVSLLRCMYQHTCLCAVVAGGGWWLPEWGAGCVSVSCSVSVSQNPQIHIRASVIASKAHASIIMSPRPLLASTVHSVRGLSVSLSVRCMRCGSLWLWRCGCCEL